VKNIRYNTLLTTEPYSDGTYWHISYRYIKNISRFDLEVVPSTKITEDNINTVLKAFDIPSYDIAELHTATHDEFMEVLSHYASYKGFEINYTMVDPDTEAREAYLESLGLGE
tara:strand:- start:202 stop:540 length:339 start_codon:yes stop_codon:yes gene_type:complete